MEKKQRVLSQKPEAIAARARHKLNPDKNKEDCRRWRLANPEKSAACKRRVYEKNREKFDLNSKLWRLNNRDRYLAYSKAAAARKRAAKKQAMPKWLTEAQVSEIKSIYANCPVGFEVDHIVPIQGKQVVGLHVPWNLQYLPMKLNRSKSNRYESY